jgi:hypothetical protein
LIAVVMLRAGRAGIFHTDGQLVVRGVWRPYRLNPEEIVAVDVASEATLLTRYYPRIRVVGGKITAQREFAVPMAICANVR